MKAVVDTNVIAYYLLGTPDFAAETQAFWRSAGELLAPSLWEAELANVVWMAVRTGGVTKDEGARKLHLAGRLGVQSVGMRALWQAALARALESSIPVYDTLFVELAARERLPLATFDGRLLTTYAAVAKRPKELLEGRP